MRDDFSDAARETFTKAEFPDRPDADFASQMLAVVTYVKDRLAKLSKSKGDK